MTPRRRLGSACQAAAKSGHSTLWQGSEVLHPRKGRAVRAQPLLFSANNPPPPPNLVFQRSACHAFDEGLIPKSFQPLGTFLCFSFGRGVSPNLLGLGARRASSQLCRASSSRTNASEQEINRLAIPGIDRGPPVPSTRVAGIGDRAKGQHSRTVGPIVAVPLHADLVQQRHGESRGHPFERRLPEPRQLQGQLLVGLFGGPNQGPSVLPPIQQSPKVSGHIFQFLQAFPLEDQAGVQAREIIRGAVVVCADVRCVDSEAINTFQN